jgi:hypothetical protein
MSSTINYKKMTKQQLIERCKKLEDILALRNINIAQSLLEKDEDVKTNYGIDYYFNTEKDEDQVCINVDFKNNI